MQNHKWRWPYVGPKYLEKWTQFLPMSVNVLYWLVVESPFIIKHIYMFLRGLSVVALVSISTRGLQNCCLLQLTSTTTWVTWVLVTWPTEFGTFHSWNTPPVQGWTASGGVYRLGRAGSHLCRRCSLRNSLPSRGVSSLLVLSWRLWCSGASPGHCPDGNSKTRQCSACRGKCMLYRMSTVSAVYGKWLIDFPRYMHVIQGVHSVWNLQKVTEWLPQIYARYTECPQCLQFT